MMRSLLVVSLVIAACGPSFQIDARVASSAGPLAGASVAMDCPQVIKKSSGPSPLGVTDASGALVMREPSLGRWLHDGCELVVTKDGYAPARIPVESACKEYAANHCTRLVVTAELAAQ